MKKSAGIPPRRAIMVESEGVYFRRVVGSNFVSVQVGDGPRKYIELSDLSWIIHSLEKPERP